MMRTAKGIVLTIVLGLMAFNAVYAQDVYELRQLTDQQWKNMSTEERLRNINTGYNVARNQTFVGQFNQNADLYPKWGYNYYDMNDRYENYAFRGFENYNIVNDRRNRWYYNQFGDRLTRLNQSANIWNERYYDDGTWGTGRSNSQNGPAGFINSVVSRSSADGIWVARESTDDWALSVVGAGALRTKLSALTLSLPNLYGMQADFQTDNTQLRMVNGVLIGRGANNATIEGSNPNNSTTLMLRGGQIRRKFGVLTLGANYVNMYSIQKNREGGHSFDGAVSDFAPTPDRYLVRILDDSPHDGNGPIVYDVKIKVDGVVRPDIVPFVVRDDQSRDLITAVTSTDVGKYLDAYTQNAFNAEKPNFDYSVLNERVPKYVDYWMLEDYVKGNNSIVVGNETNLDLERAKSYYQVVQPGAGPIQINGTETLVYTFDISSLAGKNIRSVAVVVTVANDYRIQLSEVYNNDSSGDRSIYPGEMAPYYTDSGYTTTYWKNVAQADGNIKDKSNTRTLTLEYGFEVANIIYGLDAHFNYLGFKFDGEIVNNVHKYRFSDGKVSNGVQAEISDEIDRRYGKRSSISDQAYYMVLQKQWSSFGFTGEYFKMGKFYRPHMNYYMPKNKQGGAFNGMYNNIRMSTIADNDDNDAYPDIMFSNQTMGVDYGTLKDADGVFPGNDLDGDTIPDTDKNANGLADYTEPFLTFSSDPEEFEFGDDLNNNTIPDMRENDMKDDTPYDLDRMGHHITLNYVPQENIKFTVGTLRSKSVGADLRANSDYFKTELAYNFLSVGSMLVQYRYERTQDNVRDQYELTNQTQAVPLSTWNMPARYSGDLYYDELDYRNSRVNKLYAKATLRPTNAFTIQNQVKFESNSQIEGTTYDSVFQPEDTIETVTMSNAATYTKQIGRFTVQPGLKYRFYKKAWENSINPRIHYLQTIPMLMISYTISEKTKINFGMQGFEGFEMQYKDYVQSKNNYSQKDLILQLENRTTYFGFEVWGAAGFQLTQNKFEEVFRKYEESKHSSFFVRMWFGQD